MPYVTNAERFGIEKGQIIGCRENILMLLEAKFGAMAIPSQVRQRIEVESHLDRLREWLRQAGTCASMQDFKI